MPIVDVNYAENNLELYRHITITAEKTEAPDIGYLTEFACVTPVIKAEYNQHTKVRNGLEAKYLK